jgi:hypothetical protein
LSCGASRRGCDEQQHKKDWDKKTFFTPRDEIHRELLTSQPSLIVTSPTETFQRMELRCPDTWSGFGRPNSKAVPMLPDSALYELDEEIPVVARLVSHCPLPHPASPKSVFA